MSNSERILRDYTDVVQSFCSFHLACKSSPGRKVTLLSGRSCNQIFDLEFEGVQDVLQQSAELLDMDPDTVERSGTLMIGSTAIQDLEDCVPVHARKCQVDEIGNRAPFLPHIMPVII